MDINGKNRAARSHALSLINGEYLALHFGYQTPETARTDVLDILSKSVTGCRKAGWLGNVTEACLQISEVPDASLEWAIMQFALIYLAWEV